MSESGIVSLAEAGGETESARLDEMRVAAVLRRGFRHALLLLSHALSAHDLSTLSYQLLLEVAAGGSDGVLQGDLSRLLQCPDARVSMLVRDLSERGLVRPARSAPDRRVVRIHPTPDGVRLTLEALRSQRAALHNLSEVADLPSVTSLLHDALRLYLGVDLSGEG